MKLYTVEIVGHYPENETIVFGIFDKENSEKIVNSINQKLNRFRSENDEFYESIKDVTPEENRIELINKYTSNKFEDSFHYYDLDNYEKAVATEFEINKIDEELKHFLNE